MGLALRLQQLLRRNIPMTDPVAPVPPAAPVAVAGAKTNTLAIVGFILAFLVSVAGIIVSFIALGQIKRTGEGGHGLALAGVIIGFVVTAFWLIYIVVAIIIAVSYGAAVSSLTTTY
jgi:peptidyl-prolyl cis-trans isomerase B (cyclophilin B)